MNKRAIIIVSIAAVLCAGLFAMNRNGDFLGNQQSRDTADTSGRVFPSALPAFIPLGVVSAEAHAPVRAMAITGPDGAEVSGDFQIASAEYGAESGLEIQPRRGMMKPGRYHVEGTVETPEGTRDFSQDFLWGVLAINPNKSIYRPGEKAQLAMAVLDEQGMMVCNASLKLQVKSQKSKVDDELSTENGKIRVNDECRLKQKTDKPDYAAEYVVGEPGVYEMTLTAQTANGAYVITDSFEVREDVLFDVERESATRIFPKEHYEVHLRITASRDFSGTIEEAVPIVFSIAPAEQGYRYREVRVEGLNQIIAWDVELNAGDSFEIAYSYDAPDTSPQFYLLGELVFRGNWGGNQGDRVAFIESRKWQIAVDALEWNDTFTRGSDAALSSHTSDTGGGYTAIITTGTCTLYVESSTDNLNGSTSVSTGGCGDSEGQLYRTNSAITVANYDVSITQTNGDTLDDMNALACRIQDANNMYAVRYNETDADLYIRNGGSWSTIATGSSGIVDGSTVTLRCNGSSISVLDDGVTILSATDSTHASAGYAGIGMGAVMVSTDDITTTGAQIDNFQVNTINATPSVTSVSDSPDPVLVSNNISFSVDWADDDAGENIKVKICKTNSLTNQNCDGGYWATSTAFTTSDPEAVSYTAAGGDAGTQSYYAYVCDDEGACVSSGSGSEGTFFVEGNNAPGVTSVSDTPDPTNPGRAVSFIVDWSDSDPSERVKTKICKTSGAVSAQNCPGGVNDYWATSTDFTLDDPFKVEFHVTGSEHGTTQNYYAFVCDDNANCSSLTSVQTFSVNNPGASGATAVPNVKAR